MKNTGLKYVCVIPAAGSGNRFSAGAQDQHNTLPKQLQSICGKSVLEHSLSTFLDDQDCLSIVIPVSEAHIESTRTLFGNTEKVQVVQGGSNRAKSVYLGLTALSQSFPQNTWVMVHDAARPNLRSSDIAKLKVKVKELDVEFKKTAKNIPFGAILATTSPETVKQAVKTEDNDLVKLTLDRKSVWQAKTPQIFLLGDLSRALDRVVNNSDVEAVITDEAAAMESMGAHVFLVEGRRDNIKLTHATDWHLLEFVIKQK